MIDLDDISPFRIPEVIENGKENHEDNSKETTALQPLSQDLIHPVNDEPNSRNDDEQDSSSDDDMDFSCIPDAL